MKYKVLPSTLIKEDLPNLARVYQQAKWLLLGIPAWQMTSEKTLLRYDTTKPMSYELLYNGDRMVVFAV